MPIQKTQLSLESRSPASVNSICTAAELLTLGIHLVSTDEMTGIQALERAHPTQPMGIGKVERQEFEYIRHGVAIA